MAIIPVHHTIVTQFAVASDSGSITEGMGVALAVDSATDLSPYAKLPDTNSGFTVGLAGDSKLTSTSGNAYSDSVVVSGSGGTRGTVNRVSDMFDETLASGKISVYMGVGEFLTDQYVTASFDTYTDNAAGVSLYVVQSGADAGKITATSANNGNKIGYLIAAQNAYPSGVPGTDIGGSTSLGNFIRIALNIQPA
jgi:hypothetical protein